MTYLLLLADLIFLKLSHSVKMGISRTLLDLYIQEWNEKANVSSKGKQYQLFKNKLNFEKYLINVSIFFIPNYQI